MAIRAELTEGLGTQTEGRGRLRDEMPVRYFAGWSSVALQMIRATFVRHFWNSVVKG